MTGHVVSRLTLYPYQIIAFIFNSTSLIMQKQLTKYDTVKIIPFKALGINHILQKNIIRLICTFSLTKMGLNVINLFFLYYL